MATPTFEQVIAALRPLFEDAQTPGPVTTPPSTQPPVLPPPGVMIVNVPWELVVGSQSVTIPAGIAVAFAIKPPAGSSSNGDMFSFTQSPSNDKAYYARTMCISTKPGDFSRDLGASALVQGQETRMYFSVGGRKADKYGRVDTRWADLVPGQTYYINVKQDDPALSCKINFKLYV